MTRLSRDEGIPTVSDVGALIVFGPSALWAAAVTWPWGMPALGAGLALKYAWGRSKEKRIERASENFRYVAERIVANCTHIKDVIDEDFWLRCQTVCYSIEEMFKKQGFKEGSAKFRGEGDYIRSLGPVGTLPYLRGKALGQELVDFPRDLPRLVRDLPNFVIPKRGAPWPYHDRDKELRAEKVASDRQTKKYEAQIAAARLSQRQDDDIELLRRHGPKYGLPQRRET